MKTEKNREKIEVIVVVEILEKQEIVDIYSYEEYLKKEGFIKVENDAYCGFGTTAIMNIRVFIFNVFANAFKLGGLTKCKIMCQIGKNDFETYIYKEDEIFFKEVTV